MTTIRILDTSVLITNPCAYKDFHNSEVVIPITVLDELDKLKKQPNEAGKNARVAVRLLDELSEKGDISIGVLLDNEILLSIDTKDYPTTGDALYGDTRIIACAQAVHKERKDADVILVSNDLNMRVRVRSLGARAESYDKNAAPNDLYSGIQYIKSEKLGKALLDKTSLRISDTGLSLLPNECVVFRDANAGDIVSGRRTAKDTIRATKKTMPWGLEAKNAEQELAIDLLMDSRIPLVTFIGNAGCGKSIIALAAGLELVLNKESYDRMIVYRPTVDVDEGMGWLPGSLEEKIAPWMGPIKDNLEVLQKMSDSAATARSLLEQYQRKGKIEIDALSYIRGRSIPNAFILFDEAQNCSAAQIKTVLTRVGIGSKIVMTGDVSQIDNKALDPMNNGLSYVVEKFKNSQLASHITFRTGQRSPLATEAAELL